MKSSWCWRRRRWIRWTTAATSSTYSWASSPPFSPSRWPLSSAAVPTALPPRFGFSRPGTLSGSGVFLTQCFGSGSSILGWIPVPIRIQIQSGFRVLMAKNWKNLELRNFIIFLLSKVAFYLFLGLHKGSPNYRRSLQPPKKNSQHFNTWNFFLFLCVIFSLLDPDFSTFDLDPNPHI